jgi:hypothetical protein
MSIGIAVRARAEDLAGQVVGPSRPPAVPA